tara:strand:- start:123 stop:581 length:459 start_codon:yes stop_codon:yes gene_type:complete
MPSSFEKYLILLSSALLFDKKIKIKMNKLIIDAANKEIFLMIISSDKVYNICFENSKINYEKLMILIINFLNSKNLKIGDISTIFVNRGPGSFAGIRNAISLVKGLYVSKEIDYYCYSFKDFVNIKNIKYEDIPYLCNKFMIKKNLNKPFYN